MEPWIRLGIFFGIFAVMAGWERLQPMRRLRRSRLMRWGTNWGISVLDAVMVRLIFGAAATGAALDAGTRGWGLFNTLDWPVWVEVVLVFLALDFAIWLQHLVTHKVPVLWRLHRVHHVDPEIDVTTAIRFHPVEIALSMCLKIGLVYALGAPALAVLLFEVVLNGCAMFNHGNVRLLARVDRLLRRVIVTPDMHRIHHSTIRAEHDTNFGFNLSVWDRIFGTYTAEPKGGQTGMTIGLAEHQGPEGTRIGWALAFPFARD